MGKLVGIEFAVGGIGAQRGGQIRMGGADRGLDVARGAVDVAADVELQHHLGRAHRAARGHLRDGGDGAQMPLQRRRHRGGHHFGAGARHAGADHDGGNIDIGQRRHRQQEQRAKAGQRQADRQQRGGDGAVDEQRDEVHALSSARGCRGRAAAAARAPCAQLPAPAVEIDVDHRRGEQGESWLTRSPPTIEMPRGWRSSEPMPVPTISGKAPNRAATVVIRMGRKRSSAA